MDTLDTAAIVFVFVWCGFLGFMAMRLKSLGKRFTLKLFVSWLQVLFIHGFFWLLHHRDVQERFPFLQPALWIAWCACAVWITGPALIQAFYFNGSEKSGGQAR
jgi:hypothetical protein